VGRDGTGLRMVGRTMRLIGLFIVLILAGCAGPEPPDSTAGASLPTISRSDAIDISRGQLQDVGEAWEVVLVEAGPLGQVRPGWEAYASGNDLDAELRVWRVVLENGGLSAEVVLDFVDGSVYSVTQGIAN
jgi:hypothetical protein